MMLPEIFLSEITVSRASTGRPELQKCIDQLRKGDILVVTELSRFAWSMKDVVDEPHRCSLRSQLRSALHKPSSVNMITPISY